MSQDVCCPLCGHTRDSDTTRLITRREGFTITHQIGWICEGCGAEVTAARTSHLKLVEEAR
jgi:YgiT-type zinc finger domain-containing protein